ncbi:hypothetical protein ACQP00_00475 [Dactylosporangium sp. CS-047395]|uniref:hypothetical protein n=1 Tax=Dactylosporangium sp. CS-047395 TaxID=3239936 RepID=UPI003D93A586
MVNGTSPGFPTSEGRCVTQNHLPDEWEVDLAAWRDSVNRMTASESRARDWRRARYTFAFSLSDALVGAVEGHRIAGPVLYGVWLNWGLLYIGQTAEGERRLRDLPIGESHHLATTFPPETWERVVVIEWSRLPAAEGLADEIRGVVGLALEHRLQVAFNPLVNSERRTSRGGWRRVNWDVKRSQGARAAAEVSELYAQVEAVWNAAAAHQGDPITQSEAHRIVFPARLPRL